MSQPELVTRQVNGISVAYRHWPEGAGALHPPVVLLHGLLQNGGGMQHLAEQLSLDGAVLVPDLRGRGRTEQPADGYDPATMADDVAALIEALEFGPAVLIGRLHGGLVAYHLAAKRPDLTCGLILGDANPEISDERAARILAVVSDLPPSFSSREEAEQFYQERLGLSQDRARHDLPSDLVRTDEGQYRWRHNLDVVNRVGTASMPRSDWDVLSRVECPTLILRGQRGEISPQTAERMLATISRARVQSILAAGHDVFLGPGAEQSLAAIQLFLRGFESTAG
jgi:pimeloyl-ACP methyl ester carboxylesterase